MNSKWICKLLILMAVGLAGCGGSSSEPAPATGFLTLGISDGAMHDADKICIAFDEVELKGQGEPMIIYPGENQGDVVMVDLLDFQGANVAPILFNEKVTAGHYNWLRLGVNADRESMGGTGTGGDTCTGEHSYIQMEDGTVYRLYIPSGEESGLKFVNGITIPVNRTATYVAEFDLMLSIRDELGPNPDVRLRPTVRLVNDVEVGTLIGTVDDELATDTACQETGNGPSVYVFDDGITPNSIDVEPGSEDDPIATSMVADPTLTEGTTTWDYTIGFLLPGDYEVAFTCDGENFVPLQGKPANIDAGVIETVPFMITDVGQ
ncbi:MAG: DUF4382 domain-containing protein [Gammaproteobacteria bacterium]|nr:DUF4382 domain-containing protein [Gammaproteobacteria bacterium]